MRVVPDSSVLLRLVSSTDPLYAAADDALITVGESTAELVLVPQVLYEFYVVATRSNAANGLEIPPESALAFLRQFRREIPLVADSEAVFEAWLDLTDRYGIKGTPNHDLRIVAAMVAGGIEGLLSFNPKHFRRFTEITLIDPHDVDGTLPSTDK